MSDTLEVALEALAELAEDTARVLGIVEPKAGAVVQLSAIAFHTAAGTVRVVHAAELAEIQRQRAIGLASGASALAESRQDFQRRCAWCGSTKRACDLAAAHGSAVKCCPECSHPGPHG